MPHIRRLLSFIALATSAFAAIGPTTDLVISNGVVSPDGFKRSAVLAGGTTIGPLIVGQKGDTLKINVVNQLNDNTMLQSTSIHWHGFFQAHTNWADGPAFVNQCPIPKGTSFLYDFPVRDQAGTFWYHSHLSTQYCDGLRGPIVVYDPNDPFRDMYDVDDDLQSVDSRIYRYYFGGLVPQEGEDFGGSQVVLDSVPDSTLINGLGRWKDGGKTDLAVIQVQQGKRYRMRLVNVACDPDYLFSIDGHSLTVIEADSINHKPVQADVIRIFIGQRYSFILNANQPVGNYWIRADPSRGDNGFNGGINSAILRYVGAPKAEPTTRQTGKKQLNEADLHPLENPGAPGKPFPGGVDHAINLHISTVREHPLKRRKKQPADSIVQSQDHFALNGVQYVSPTVPVLLQVLSGARQPGELLPKGSVYELPANASIEISFTGAGVKGFEHPMHLHGHAFDVVRVSGSKTYNYVDPPRRDVVSSGKGGDNVTIRFFTDNPWAMVPSLPYRLAPRAGALALISITAAWDDLCPEYNALAPGDL
ncbi:laccase, multicopper oxidase, benzenediol:oxygen oxidorectuctase [Paramarasmius palmivorus]|uniref:Laccase, multicopper oxidase, benzenediol:oxygen oxidorectuctase n=1 Tax=Paramarasmius palmivorus TaxID=297713 RepID=A0AAW0B160_9AGAR